MNADKKIARRVGGLFLIAMAASLVGGGLVEAFLSTPDYLGLFSEYRAQVLIGVLLELTNAIAVVGIGALMFPILKPHHENRARGYLGLRIIEGVFCSLMVVSPLSLLTLGQEYAQAGASEAAYFRAAGALAMAQRASLVDLLIPLFFSLGALLFYSSLYRARLLPRWISAWGFVAAVLVLALNLLSLNTSVDMAIGLVLALPIISNEIFLGIWLIARGFTPSTGVSTGIQK